MEGFVLGVGTAIWLGILTSISPCPLATNLAAVSFIGRQMGRPARVVSAGLLYILGRVIAYTVLGAFLVAGILSIPGVARFLQNSMNQLLGPVLIIAGLFLLGLFKLPSGRGTFTAAAQKRLEHRGLLGALLLGCLFALSFCPISAGLFFGSLLPLAAAHQSSLLFPSLYGIGTGLPVLGFAVLVGFGAHWIGKAFQKVTVFEYWARRITGGIFVLVGIYYCLNYLLKIG